MKYINEQAQIIEGLREVSQNYLTHRKENASFYDNLSKDIDKIEKPFGNYCLGKILFPLRKKGTIALYNHRKTLKRLWNDEYLLVRNISERVSKPNVLSQEMGGLERELGDFAKKWEESVGGKNIVIYELRFQFPDFVNESLNKGYLNVPSEKIRSFNVNVLNQFINNLTKYAKKYEEQTKNLIKKASEVYKIDNQRGVDGKRWTAGCSIGLGGLSWSTASESLGLIRQLGKALGWSEEQTFSFCGLIKQEVENNERNATKTIHNN